MVEEDFLLHKFLPLSLPPSLPRSFSLCLLLFHVNLYKSELHEEIYHTQFHFIHENPDIH